MNRNEFTHYTAQYGYEIEDWPAEVQDEARSHSDDKVFSAILAEEKDLSQSLSHIKLDSARDDLAEIIINRAYHTPQQYGFAFVDIWQETIKIFHIRIPQYSLASFIILGMVIGAYLPTPPTTIFEDTTIETLFNDTEDLL